MLQLEVCEWCYFPSPRIPNLFLTHLTGTPSVASATLVRDVDRCFFNAGGGVTDRLLSTEGRCFFSFSVPSANLTEPPRCWSVSVSSVVLSMGMTTLSWPLVASSPWSNAGLSWAMPPGGSLCGIIVRFLEIFKVQCNNLQSQCLAGSFFNSTYTTTISTSFSHCYQWDCIFRSYPFVS